MTIQAPSHSLMRQSSGATYSNWLLACDRWLASLSNGCITGTYCLCISEWDWRGAFDRDLLPSDAAKAALAAHIGVGEA